MNYENPQPGQEPRQLPSPREAKGAGVAFVSRTGKSIDIHLSTDLIEYLRIVSRRKSIVVIAGFVGALAGLLIALPQAATYRADTAVEIQAPNEDFLYARDVNPVSASNSSYPEMDLMTQVRLLQARPLLERVVKKLDSRTDLHPVAPQSRFTQWQKVLHIPQPPAPTRLDLIRDATGGVRVRASPTSRIVEISCESTDPKVAAAFANTMASEFIDQSLEARWESAQHTGEWMGRQLDELKVKLEKAEDELQRYAKSMNLVFSGDKENTNIAEDKLRQLQTDLEKAETERIAKQSQFESASKAPLDSLPAILDDDSLRAGHDKLNDLRRQLAELSSSYTAEHYKVKRAQAQVAEMEAQQEKQRQRILGRISDEYDEAARREALLRASYDAQATVLSDQSQKSIHYNVLKREVETNRQLYESLSQKVKEAGVASAMRASNVRIVEPAQTPTVPFRPQPRRDASLGMVTGLLGGAVLALIIEKSKRSICLPGESALCLGVRELGTIPSESLLDGGPGFVNIWRRRVQEGPRPVQMAGKRNGEIGDQLDRITYERGNSLLAESFRGTLTSLLATSPARDGGHMLVVSSPAASDGKTTVVSNLAIAFAEINRRVLLIDADTRRPRLHKIFSTTKEPGLLELLQRSDLSRSDLETYIRPTGVPGLFLLPSGERKSAMPNLLYSSRLKELIAMGRSQFDAVLIDTPPILHLSDARVIGTHTDGVVLIVRSGSTTREAALAAKHSLADDGIRVVGTVLNDWNPRLTGYYGYESYKNYYRSYADL